MRLPNRQLPWLVALLLLAAIPTSLVALRSTRWDDCAAPDALLDAGSLFEGQPVEFQRLFRSHVFQRNEGTLSAGPGLPLNYRFVRTDQPRYPYDQPTRLLRVPMDPDRSIVRQVEADGSRIPVHLFYTHLANSVRVVASLYIYDGRAVDSLLPMQIRSALPQLVRGRRPLTLFQVDGVGPPSARGRIEDRAIAWLTSGWSAYRKVCASSPADPAA